MLDEIYHVVFRFLGLFCHQIPERSLFVWGVQLPLCIRCCALLAGACLAVVYLFARLPLPAERLCIGMALLLPAEAAAVGMGLWHSDNWTRGVNGLLFGFFFLMGAMIVLAGRAGRASSPMGQHRQDGGAS